jgi:hypothetical protein
MAASGVQKQCSYEFLVFFPFVSTNEISADFYYVEKGKRPCSSHPFFKDQDWLSSRGTHYGTNHPEHLRRGPDFQVRPIHVHPLFRPWNTFPGSVTRLGGTFLGLVLGLIAWYAGDLFDVSSSGKRTELAPGNGSGNGNPYGATALA